MPEFQGVANLESETYVSDRAVRQVLCQGAVHADKLV
jgi:hypothetical protein